MSDELKTTPDEETVEESTGESVNATTEAASTEAAAERAEAASTETDSGEVVAEAANAEGETDEGETDEGDDEVAADNGDDATPPEPAPAAAAPTPAPVDASSADKAADVAPKKVAGPPDYTPYPQRGRSRRIRESININDINYKNVSLLARFLDSRGRILSRRKTGVSAKMQRRVVTEVKRARHLALLPFTGEHFRITSLKKRR